MRTNGMLANREEAGWRLAERLRSLPLTDPVVLAIPRGGIEVAAPVARTLGADLDVVLSRKIGAPDQPELALGAVSESGDIYLNELGRGLTGEGREYIESEWKRQVAEIDRRRAIFREARPQVPVAGRSVIVVDDGIATGSTMMAALETVRAEGAKEIVVAVPVAPLDRLAPLRELCDRVICLDQPSVFWAIGQFYRDFAQVSDERVLELLREHAPFAAPPRT
jgi:putative phosphoribosyl transferase